MDALTPLVLQFIEESPTKVSFSTLKKVFRKTHKANANDLKVVVSELVQAGVLCYTDHYGSSFIDVSYNHPRIVSEHVVLKPPRCSCCVSPGQRVVSLGRGASFGGGDHPSTRLAIQLIDVVLSVSPYLDKKQAIKGLDIGTGSGVLAIVAAMLGVGTVLGIDTDPCAVYEAQENVRLNHLVDRVQILGRGLETIDESYDMVLANLRAPTLFGYRDYLSKTTANDSLLVFSGLKSDETKSLVDFYKKSGFFLFKERLEKGWGAICLIRGDLVRENP